MIKLRNCLLVAALASLSACATGPTPPPDFAAKNRAPEDRCLRAAINKPGTPRVSGGPKTRAEVQAEARAATQRGELDAVCNWL